MSLDSFYPWFDQSGQTHLTAPLISPKAKKILGFFLVKDLFFSIGKKGRGLTALPYFREKCSEGGAVRWVCPDTSSSFVGVFFNFTICSCHHCGILNSFFPCAIRVFFLYISFLIFKLTLNNFFHTTAKKKHITTFLHKPFEYFFERRRIIM